MNKLDEIYELVKDFEKFSEDEVRKALSECTFNEIVLDTLDYFNLFVKIKEIINID